MLPLKSRKAGRFEKLLGFARSHFSVTRGSVLSRAPPYHTFPAFINLNGRSIGNIGQYRLTANLCYNLTELKTGLYKYLTVTSDMC